MTDYERYKRAEFAAEILAVAVQKLALHVNYEPVLEEVNTLVLDATESLKRIRLGSEKPPA